MQGYTRCAAGRSAPVHVVVTVRPCQCDPTSCSTDVDPKKAQTRRTPNILRVSHLFQRRDTSKQAVGVAVVPNVASVLCETLDAWIFAVDVSILSRIQTRFSRLRPRPRTRTRPSHHNTIQPNTTTGWLFASGSSWTLGHNGGSRQDTHGTLVPGREGRGWPTTCSTTDDRQTDDKP